MYSTVHRTDLLDTPVVGIFLSHDLLYYIYDLYMYTLKSTSR